VNIFFDEDNGTGIPKALQLIRPKGDHVHYPSDRGHQLIKKGEQDRVWIPRVGDAGYLVFSQNKWMLHNAEERGLLIRSRVGAVFLASGNDTAFEVMKVIVRRWDWLRLLDRTVPRPFAYLLTIGGEARKLDMHAALPLGRGQRAPGIRVPTSVPASGSTDPAPPGDSAKVLRAEEPRFPGF